MWDLVLLLTLGPREVWLVWKIPSCISCQTWQNISGKPPEVSLAAFYSCHHLNDRIRGSLETRTSGFTFSSPFPHIAVLTVGHLLCLEGRLHYRQILSPFLNSLGTDLGQPRLLPWWGSFLAQSFDSYPSFIFLLLFFYWDIIEI